MRISALLFLVLCFGLLSACGGGSGGAAVDADAVPRKVIRLAGGVLTHEPRTIHYRVTGQIERVGADPVAVEGTAAVQQGQPETIGGLLSACLVRQEEVPPLEPAHGQVFTRRDEAAGAALQTGRRLAEGDLVTWHTPYVQSPLRYVEGASWSTDEENLGYSVQARAARLRQDAVSWSVDRVGIVEVPAGVFECYVVYRTERLHDLVTGVTDAISTIEYVRPDFGVIQATVRVNRTVGGEMSAHVLTYEATAIY